MDMLLPHPAKTPGPLLRTQPLLLDKENPPLPGKTLQKTARRGLADISNKTPAPSTRKAAPLTAVKSRYAQEDEEPDQATRHALYTTMPYRNAELELLVASTTTPRAWYAYASTHYTPAMPPPDYVPDCSPDYEPEAPATDLPV